MKQFRFAEKIMSVKVQEESSSPKSSDVIFRRSCSAQFSLLLAPRLFQVFSLHFAFHAPQGFYVVLLHYDENKKINKRIKTATTTKMLYDLLCKTNKEFTVEVMGGFWGGEKGMETYDVLKVTKLENSRYEP